MYLNFYTYMTKKCSFGAKKLQYWGGGWVQAQKKKRARRGPGPLELAGADLKETREELDGFDEFAFDDTLDACLVKLFPPASRAARPSRLPRARWVCPATSSLLP